MSEIRFKISGDSPTFIARLYDATATTLLQTKLVSESGTTISFGKLAPSTQYFVNASDKYGYVVGEYIITPAHYTPIALPTRTLRMSNSYSSANPYVCTAHGTVISTLPLVSGDFVDVNFSAIMTNTSTDPEGGVWNSISICCKPNGSSTYSTICQLNNTDDYNEDLPPITIGYGDTLAFDISTITNSSYSIGSSQLIINTLTNSIGFVPSIGSPNNACVMVSEPIAPPTTTTTTTIAPQAQLVEFGGTTLSNTEFKKEFSSPLIFTPPLGDGCTVTVLFRSWACSTADEMLPKTILSHANSPTESVDSIIVGGTTTTNDGNMIESSISVNSTNVNTSIFNILAQSHPTNAELSHSTFAKSEIIGATSTSSGVITVNPSKNIIAAYVCLDYQSGVYGG